MSFWNRKYLKKWREEITKKWKVANSITRKKTVPKEVPCDTFDTRAKDFCVVCKEKLWKGNYLKNGNFCGWCCANAAQKKHDVPKQNRNWQSYLQAWKKEVARIRTPVEVVRERIRRAREERQKIAL